MRVPFATIAIRGRGRPGIAGGIMSLRPGTLLVNRYRVEAILGQGGMGAVYRAVDANLGVTVAVKENLFTTEDFARQFVREAGILANLRHSGLPRVTDHFVIEGEGGMLVHFGLAKVVVGTGTTTTGAKAMTPGFSPPEQYGTGRTDSRTDIYSLSATMYAAFTAGIPEDALERNLGREYLTPLRERNPRVSGAVARV